MIAPPLPAPGAARPPQIDQLTGLRGIAAWFVVVYHMRMSCTAIMPEWALGVFDRGYLAVDLFFMLSGFVMWLNYADRMRRGGLRQAPAFWWKRVARIWPLHLAILAAMAAFALVLLATGRETANDPFAQLPLHVFLLQNWGLTEALAWNHPAWSISTELAAYLVFPFIVLAVRWEKLPSVMLVVLAGLLCGAIFALFSASGHDWLGADIPQLGLWRCLFEFAVGIVLALLWQRWQSLRRAGVRIAAALVGLLAIAWALDLTETAFVPAAFALLLLALALGQGPVVRLFACRPMRMLGDLSYATYLAHYFLFILFKVAFVGPDAQLGVPQFAAFLLLLLAVSAALFHAFEKPAQRALNALRPAESFRNGLPARP
ncbi:acyltransferase family protein [Alteriqipengyuania sp. 357]